MYKSFIVLPALALFICTLASCQPSGNQTAAPELSTPVSMAGQLNSESPESTPAVTSIAFTETSHNFGEQNLEGDFSHKFTFTNSGTQDLIIEKVKPSCSCTVTEYTKEAVKPGESGFIMAQYNPKKDYQGAFSKTVTVIANTDPSNTILSISGEVVQ